MLVFLGVAAIGLVVLALAILWTLGHPARTLLWIEILVCAYFVSHALDIGILHLLLVCLVGYRLAPLVQGFIEGVRGRDAEADQPRFNGPA